MSFTNDVIVPTLVLICHSLASHAQKMSIKIILAFGMSSIVSFTWLELARGKFVLGLLGDIYVVYFSPLSKNEFFAQ